MFTITSNDFSHSPEETYDILNEYLNLKESSLEQLASSGVVLRVQRNEFDSMSLVKVELHRDYYVHLYNAIVADLKELSVSFDEMCEQHEIRSAQDFIRRELTERIIDCYECNCDECLIEASRFESFLEFIELPIINLEMLEQIIAGENLVDHFRSVD